MGNNFTSSDFKVHIQERYTRYDISKSSKTGKMITMCTLRARIDSPVMESRLPGQMPTYVYSDAFTQDNNGIIIARAKAVCSEGDVYDEEVGKKVARAKAEAKLYSLLDVRVINNFRNYVLQMCEYVKKFHNKTRNVIEHNKKYIDSITQK